jgi:hypothetical protein
MQENAVDAVIYMPIMWKEGAGDLSDGSSSRVWSFAHPLRTPEDRIGITVAECRSGRLMEWLIIFQGATFLAFSIASSSSVLGSGIHSSFCTSKQ